MHHREMSGALYEEAREWPHLTYGAALEHLAARCPDREPFVFHHVEKRGAEGRATRRADTAAEFLTKANRLARGLLARGVGAGERVALWLANMPEAAIAEFAIAKIGADGSMPRPLPRSTPPPP